MVELKKLKEISMKSIVSVRDRLDSSNWNSLNANVVLRAARVRVNADFSGLNPKSCNNLNDSRMSRTFTQTR